MSIANNPFLNCKQWKGEVEIYGGEIYDFYADATILYTENRGQISIDTYIILVREKIWINGQEVEIFIDYTNRVKPETVEKLVDEYIINA